MFPTPDGGAVSNRLDGGRSIPSGVGSCQAAPHLTVTVIASGYQVLAINLKNTMNAIPQGVNGRHPIRLTFGMKPGDSDGFGRNSSQRLAWSGRHSPLGRRRRCRSAQGLLWRDRPSPSSPVKVSCSSGSLQTCLIAMRNFWLNYSANHLFKWLACEGSPGRRQSWPFNFLPHR
jgi:hypothetical protein